MSINKVQTLSPNKVQTLSPNKVQTLSLDERLSLNKLPRELLIEIIIKQNSEKYLSTSECVGLIRKLEKRIIENCTREFKTFFKLPEEIFTEIKMVCIEKSRKGYYNVWLNNRLALKFEKGKLVKYYNEILDEEFNPAKMLPCENTFIQFVIQHEEASYNFILKLLDQVERDNMWLEF